MRIVAAIWATAAIGAISFAGLTGDASSVEVRNLEKPGAVVIENHGGPARLSRKILIERKRGSDWIESPAWFEAVEQCVAPQPADRCVVLDANTKIEPVPWNGLTCSGQCPRSCRSNHYTGPGTFRFVVLSCDHKERFAGPEFSIPAEKR